MRELSIPNVKRILILLFKARIRAVLEVAVLRHGCGLTTCRKVLHLLQRALQTSLLPTQEPRDGSARRSERS